ncbi:MAG: XdhC family protein, partial [bacterium]
MSNDLRSLLEQWFPQKDTHRWVLGAVYKVEGSAYRKPGAFMLFNDDGQQFGLLSGGCLEADLHRQAMKALALNKALAIRYDSSDEDDMTFKLGLGCGGIVDILLQPLSAENGHLQLGSVLNLLKSRKPFSFWQQLPDANDATIAARIVESDVPAKSSIATFEGREWLATPIQPQPHLLVIGGGIDARPLVAIANQLGWETSVLDPRPANARREFFPQASRISSVDPADIAKENWLSSVDAVVVMSHSKDIDSRALGALSKCCDDGLTLKYIALIGPHHRRDEVLQKAGLSNDTLPFHL